VSQNAGWGEGQYDTSISHILFTNNGGDAPTVGSGTTDGGTNSTITGNDNVSVVTVGTSPGTLCTVTFTNASTTAPICFGEVQTTANLLHRVITTSTLAIHWTLTAGDQLRVHWVSALMQLLQLRCMLLQLRFMVDISARKSKRAINIVLCLQCSSCN
jgi:hypothetical protein